MPDRLRVRVGDRDLELSNLDKVLYPAAGFTKGEVIDYYTRMAECAKVAVLLRDRLAADDLVAYPKTSGKKGMQLMCALAAEQSAEEVSAYAKLVAEELAGRYPRMITAKMAKNLRPGKVFIDWSQNSAAKTTVAPYSLRAESVPTASAPLTWDEVESGKVRPVQAGQVLKRVDKYGDLLAALCDGGPRVPPP